MSTNPQQGTIPASKPACVCIRLRRATRAVTKLYDDALATSGLNITQYSLLSSVLKLAPISFGELAAANMLERSTLGRNIRVLERKGFVEFEPGDDERERIVRVTVAGATLIASSRKLWDVAQGDVAKSIGAQELKSFLRTLDKLEELAAVAE